MDVYHQKYINLSNEEIENRLHAKKDELTIIFNNIPYNSSDTKIRLAVMGCGDKRFVKGHKRIFEETLKKQVEITTFDITLEHLAGEENIIQHDCTFPLSDTSYTFTYTHVLLKFIPIEKQWNVIKNSYDALEINGMAIHVLDKEDYETFDETLPGGYFTVPLKRWIEKLDELGIKHQEIPIKHGIALILLK
jgi:hypothetical protein